MNRIFTLPKGNRIIRERLLDRVVYFREKIQKTNQVWGGHPLWDSALYRRSFYSYRLISELLDTGKADIDKLAIKLEKECGFINRTDFSGVCSVMERLLQDKKELGEE